MKFFMKFLNFNEIFQISITKFTYIVKKKWFSDTGNIYPKNIKCCGANSQKKSPLANSRLRTKNLIIFAPLMSANNNAFMLILILIYKYTCAFVQLCILYMIARKMSYNWKLKISMTFLFAKTTVLKHRIVFVDFQSKKNEKKTVPHT